MYEFVHMLRVVVPDSPNSTTSVHPTILFQGSQPQDINQKPNHLNKTPKLHNKPQ
jgi:hypothetical protein